MEVNNGNESNSMKKIKVIQKDFESIKQMLLEQGWRFK